MICLSPKDLLGQSSERLAVGSRSATIWIARQSGFAAGVRPESK